MIAFRGLQGFARRLDDPDRLHHGVRALPGKQR
jgi:hypothetical protein